MDLYLSVLFNHLSISGIRYCLLTDFECDLASNDLDLYIHTDSRADFEEKLYELGWYRRKEPAHHVNHHFYYYPNADIYLDVKYSLSFANGRHQCFSYTHPEEVLENSVKNQKGVVRPSGTDAIVLYAAHLAFKERGKLEAKHGSYLSRYITAYQTESEEAPAPVTSEISEWMESSFPNDLAKLQQIIRPFFSFEQKKMTRAKRFRYGFGVNVLFLGTDGSGKTTLIEEVNKHINLKCNKLYLGTGEKGWSSPLLKGVFEYRLKNRTLDRLLDSVRVYAALPLDFFLRIIPVKSRSRYSLTLIDRFPGTVFLENRPKRIAFYKSILPKPDLVFFLYANPEDLVKRKPNETTLQKSSADIAKFRRVADVLSGGGFKEINTSYMSICEARDFVISEIYRHPKVYEKLLTSELQKVH